MLPKSIQQSFLKRKIPPQHFAAAEHFYFLFCLIQRLLDEGQEEFPLTDFVPRPFRYPGQMILQALEQRLRDLKGKRPHVIQFCVEMFSRS